MSAGSFKFIKPLAASTVGPKGATGPKGPAGPAGKTGAVGPAGPAGKTGAVGPAGPKGGPAGPTGASGPRGANGANGAAGPAGAQGLVGPAGPAGPAGVAGHAGPAGPAGAGGTPVSEVNIVGTVVIIEPPEEPTPKIREIIPLTTSTTSSTSITCLDNVQGTSSIGTELLLTVQGSDGTATTKLDNKGLLTVHQVQLYTTTYAEGNAMSNIPGSIIFPDGSNQITAYPGPIVTLPIGIISSQDSTTYTDNTVFTASVDPSNFSQIGSYTIDSYLYAVVISVNATVTYTDTTLQPKIFSIRHQDTNIYSQTFTSGYGALPNTVSLNAIIKRPASETTAISLSLDSLPAYEGFEILSHSFAYTVTAEYIPPTPPSGGGGGVVPKPK